MTKTHMQYICDTNFLLHYLLADDPEMFFKATKLFEQEKKGKIKLVVEQSVFKEVLAALSSVKDS